MNAKTILTFSLLLLLIACSQKKINVQNGTKVADSEMEFDTFHFARTILVQHPRNVDSIAGNIEFNWIVPKDKQLQKDLLHFISDSTFDDFEKYSNAQIDSFDKNYREVLNDWFGYADSGETFNSFLAYEQDESYEPILNNEQYLVMQGVSYGYTGGAHGYSGESFYTYRKSDKKWLKIDDVLNLKYEKEINSVLDNEVRAKYKLKDTQNLGEAESEDKDNFVCFLVDSFFYTSNFTVDTKGIYFHYGNYEVQCYAGGYYELFVPYKKLKPYLVKDFKY